MEQRARLKARIDSIKELRDLVRMLRALAATHLREAQAALSGIREYVATVEEALAAAGSLLPSGISDGSGHGGAALILITSEHGFAGAFNDRLVDAALEALKPGVSLGVIGRRGALLAQERGLETVWSLPMATHVGGVLGVTRQAVDRLARVGDAQVLYASYRSGGQFDVSCQRILPLDPALLAAPPAVARPLHQLPPAELVTRLAGEYLFAEISRAMMESMASENGVRLRVMEAATNAIDDKVELLTRQDQHMRQEEITTELMDVIAGANAVGAGN